jgi:hypothetical protein
MSYRAEDGAAASGLAINLPDSISPELLKAAMEITSSLHRLAPNVNVNKEAVTVGRGAAGAIAVNVYEAKKKCPDRDMISASSAFTSIFCCPSLFVCVSVSACLPVPCLCLFPCSLKLLCWKVMKNF